MFISSHDTASEQNRCQIPALLSEPPTQICFHFPSALTLAQGRSRGRARPSAFEQQAQADLVPRAGAAPGAPEQTAARLAPQPALCLPGTLGTEPESQSFTDCCPRASLCLAPALRVPLPPSYQITPCLCLQVSQEVSTLGETSPSCSTWQASQPHTLHDHPATKQQL